MATTQFIRAHVIHDDEGTFKVIVDPFRETQTVLAENLTAENAQSWMIEFSSDRETLRRNTLPKFRGTPIKGIN